MKDSNKCNCVGQTDWVKQVQCKQEIDFVETSMAQYSKNTRVYQAIIVGLASRLGQDWCDARFKLR